MSFIKGHDTMLISILAKSPKLRCFQRSDVVITGRSDCRTWNKQQISILLTSLSFLKICSNFSYCNFYPISIFCQFDIVSLKLWGEKFSWWINWKSVCEYDVNFNELSNSVHICPGYIYTVIFNRS